MMDFSLDFKRGLKSLWANSLRKKPSLEASGLALGINPYRKGDPLAEALRYLALQNTRGVAPPLIPRISPMPIAELCQLVLLWIAAGEKEAASALAYSIPMDFPWLWCREQDYNEQETLASLLLLSRSLGRTEECTLEGDPYFRALSQNLSRLTPPDNFTRCLDWSQTTAEGLECCLTFSGARTSLGAVLSEIAEIRAFGPHVYPLSNPMGFGIREIIQHGNRWASLAAAPEVWFSALARKDGSGILLDLTFFGVKPSAPLGFCFYIKAESAQIGSEKLKPQTLQRYSGISKPVQFGGSLPGLRIESLTSGKMEVIPLAGGGGYWNCEYLAAFEVHPVNAKMTFFISYIM